MTAAVPDPRFRDQLAEGLPESLGPVGLRRRAIPALGVEASVTGYGLVLLDALMPTIAAEVEARVQAAARPAEPTGELRERIYREVVLTEAVSANGASHIADALLSGPLAPLLAKLRAIEALADDWLRDGSAPAHAIVLRRALDAS